MPFDRILMPLDFTESNRRAVEIVAELIHGRSARVVALHVIETVRGLPREELADFYDRLESSARERLAAIATDLSRSDETVEVREEIVYGRRAEEIIAHAEKHRNDLIVLSSHPLDRERRRLPGSISHKVALVARCPVLLVR